MLYGLKDGANRGFGKRNSPSTSSVKYFCQSGGTEDGSRTKSSYSLSTYSRLLAPGNGTDFCPPFVLKLALSTFLGSHLQRRDHLAHAIGIEGEHHSLSDVIRRIYGPGKCNNAIRRVYRDA